MAEDYSKAKKIMLAIGISLLAIGIIILIYGFMNFGGLFGSSSDSIDEMGGKGFSSVMAITGGGFMLVVGLGLIYMSQFRKVFSYVATEASPGIETTSHALGKGIRSGLKESGVGESNKKEVIKIKCQHCGYLDSEDAEFCSKCGKKI